MKLNIQLRHQQDVCRYTSCFFSTHVLLLLEHRGGVGLQQNTETLMASVKSLWAETCKKNKNNNNRCGPFKFTANVLPSRTLFQWSFFGICFFWGGDLTWRCSEYFILHSHAKYYYLFSVRVEAFTHWGGVFFVFFFMSTVVFVSHRKRMLRGEKT